MRYLLQFIILILLSTANGTFPSSGHVKSVIKSLTQVVQFYNNSIEKANFDGVYGLRVVEGVMQHIKDDFMYSLLEDSIQYKIRSLLHSCKDPIRRGILTVAREEPQQFASLNVLIAQPFTIKHEPRSIKPEIRWPFVLNVRDSFNVLDEKTSDRCFGVLFAGNSAPSCKISAECERAVTTPNLQSYPLTHQILFSIEAEKNAKCFQVWDNLLGVRGYYSNREFQRIWCTNSYYEMLGYVQTGHTRAGDRYHTVQPRNLDLFFEHLFVCPSIGFYEFLKEEFISIIINAQDSSGCFKDALMSSHKRSMLEEKNTEDGCMFHLTSVAAAALSVYLHYLLVVLYTPDRLDLDLLNDNKHYLETVEQHRQELLPRKSRNIPTFNYEFYIIFVFINLIFLLLIIAKFRIYHVRRLCRQVLPR